ncbi:MAG: hypothetical protein AAF961_15400 [Planctomycetota bacterium]
MLIAALLSLTSQATLSASRRVAQNKPRDIARVCLENILDQAAALPWQALDEATLREMPSVLAVGRRWPEANLTLQVTDEDAPPTAKRLRLSLALRDADATRPVHLTAWFYRQP